MPNEFSFEPPPPRHDGVGDVVYDKITRTATLYYCGQVFDLGGPFENYRAAQDAGKNRLQTLAVKK
jgi:hypothetical protein